MKTGVTGATGQLGRLVIEKLKELTPAQGIVALTRSPEKGADLGVEVREFDYTKTDSLPAALTGIDHLLLISSNEIGQRAAQHLNVINAAKKAGVKWIVYTSLLHADRSSISLAGEHLASENALKKSGIPFTILRNGWYTENSTGSLKSAVAAGALVGSAGDGLLSSATRKDFADAAAKVLAGKNHQGKIYELAGDKAFTMKDLAAEVSAQTGKTIPYRNLSETEYSALLKTFGIPAGLADAIAGWDISVSKGDLYEDSRQLSGLIGRPTTPLSAVVKEALKIAG